MTATVQVVQTNFTAGELSPRMLGRMDVERYKNGAEILENVLPLIQGGVRSTPMLEYIEAAKYSDRKCRLIRFEFSKTQANILEVGHQYIRFFNQDGSQVMDGGSPVEIATDYDESELFELEFVGGADTIFMFHTAHFPQRIRRYANDNWVIEDAPFVVQPFAELGHKPSPSLTLSDASAGSGRTFTAGSSAFLPGDVGRYISYNQGLALITGYTSATVVTCTIEKAFGSTSISSGVWLLDGSPQLICQPSEAATVGSTINLDLSTGTVYGVRQTLSNATWSSGTPDEITFTTAASHGISIGATIIATGCVPLEYNGTYEVTSTSPVDLVVQYGPNPGSITELGTVQSISSGGASNGWRTEDVGKLVKINGGLCLITAFNSAQQVEAKILQELSSDAAAQIGSWSLNTSVWSSANGYPRAGCFYQQRLILGGSTSYPHTIWASRSGEYLNFELGVEDDDAFSYDIDATEYNPIIHLTSTKQRIIVLTSGGEFTITGGIERPLAVTNVQIEDPTKYGSNSVKPVKVGNDVMYWQRGGRKLRAMGYQLESDGFSSPDLSKLSEHITLGGVVDMAYQQEPDSVIWAVRSDGVMITIGIDSAEGVIAWTRQVTANGGEYESVAVIPDDDDGDQVWCVVKRTIGGHSVRYIERYNNAAQYNLHSAVTATSVGGTDTWTGLDHLNGQTVEIVADGFVMAQQVVTGGSITLDRAAYEVFIGLPVLPTIKTLNPELVTQSGSAQGNNIRIGRVVVRVLDTYALLINDQFVDMRRYGDSLLDQAPEAFSGDFDVTSIGWKKSAFVEIRAANALPFHILAIIQRVTVTGP